MKKKDFLTCCIGLMLCAGFGFAQSKPNEQGEDEQSSKISTFEMNPFHLATAPTAGGTAALTPITNHGGPVMTGTVNVYVIWYGNWNQANGSDTPVGQALVRTFLRNIGGSAHFNINTTYPGVSGMVTLVKEVSDAGSQGTALTDAKVKSIVTTAIANGSLTRDTNGVYFVLTSSNVSESSGFCTQYCGWHTRGTISGANIKYSFVGNAHRCLNGCAPQTISPNNNAGVDGMISVIAHELEETVTDPNLNAWYDRSGAENADKCAWTFGSAQTVLPSGASYNMTLGGVNYLIQRNLKATDSKCYVTNAGQQ